MQIKIISEIQIKKYRGKTTSPHKLAAISITAVTAYNINIERNTASILIYAKLDTYNTSVKSGETHTDHFHIVHQLVYYTESSTCLS